MQLNSVSLDERIENVREKLGDRVEVSEVSTIIEEILGTIEGDFNLQEVHFQDELRELLAYIEQTKADLIDIHPKYLSENKIPEASNQLDMVVTATEEAATKIMDSAEELSELASSLDGPMAAQLEAISMKIFEASSFQDITGQRVTKVVDTLKHLEEKLSDLAKAIGDTDSHIKVQEKAKEVCPETGENLLQGPQCAVTANDQDAIDALLASFD